MSTSKSKALKHKVNVPEGWYSDKNQRKMHHSITKKLVKKEFRGPEYEKTNRAFPN